MTGLRVRVDPGIGGPRQLYVERNGHGTYIELRNRQQAHKLREFLQDTGTTPNHE